MTLAEAVEALVSCGQWPALGLLCLSSALEYVFPPFPGDTVTLAGAAIARVGGWSYPLVFLALTLGSLVGATADYLFGKHALSRERILRHRHSEKHRGAMERILDGYRRYGPAFLIANRFMPGIRALFFVAAGTAGIPLSSVLFYATVSAACFNGVLLYVGFVIGDNMERLESLFQQYLVVAWVLLATAALVGLVVWLRRKQRRDRQPNSHGSNSQMK